MKKSIEISRILFEVNDVFSKRVRTTIEYWSKIKQDKHRELSMSHFDVIATLQCPDDVYLSVKDPYIRIFYKQYGTMTLVVLVKYLNGNGFVVTVYQTTKVKRKGEKIWPK